MPPPPPLRPHFPSLTSPATTFPRAAWVPATLSCPAHCSPLCQEHTLSRLLHWPLTSALSSWLNAILSKEPPLVTPLVLNGSSPSLPSPPCLTSPTALLALDLWVLLIISTGENMNPQRQEFFTFIVNSQSLGLEAGAKCLLTEYLKDSRHSSSDGAEEGSTPRHKRHCHFSFCQLRGLD